jgi:hypothetical protein
MAKKVKIGDVFEIKTKKGLAYAQYTHFHAKPPRYGYLIRILPGFFHIRPSGFSDLVNLRSVFVKFFPLQAAVNRNIVTIVANESIPVEALSFPVFRAGMIDPKTKKVHVWWFWDGEREWKIGAITEEQKKMPIRGLVNDTMLIELIESGWTPENDPYT